MIERADEAISEYVSKRLNFNVIERTVAPRPMVKKPLTPAQKRQRYEAAIAASKKRKKQHRKSALKAAKHAVEHAAGEALMGVGYAQHRPLPYRSVGFNPIVGKGAPKRKNRKVKMHKPGCSCPTCKGKKKLMPQSLMPGVEPGGQAVTF